jgi:protein TonB
MLSAILLATFVAHAPVVQPLASQTSPAQQPKAGVTQAETPWPPAGVVRAGDQIVAPRAVKEFKPAYTPEALRQGIEGVVVMEAVVRTDGRVGQVRVKRSLDRQYGLDDRAVSTLKKWRFEPGTRDGVAVPVLVEVEMAFSKK